MNFYDITQRYNAAIQQVHTQIGLEVADEIRLLMKEAKLSDNAVESMVLSANFYTNNLDDGFETMANFTVIFDATNSEPTVDQGEHLRDLIEMQFNPDDTEENQIVYTNEPYDEEGTPQHIIEFEISMSMELYD